MQYVIGLKSLALTVLSVGYLVVTPSAEAQTVSRKLCVSRSSGIIYGRTKCRSTEREVSIDGASTGLNVSQCRAVSQQTGPGDDSVARIDFRCASSEFLLNWGFRNTSSGELLVPRQSTLVYTSNTNVPFGVNFAATAPNDFSLTLDATCCPR